MSSIHLIESAQKYVSENIGTLFHEKILTGLKELKLKKLLQRKNPYLFKAKATTAVDALIRMLLDAYLSSREETVFGDFLEKLAIHVCHGAFGGRKSASEGIDLEFERDGKRYLVSVKSGPSWGNSQQIKRMQENFRQARKIIGKEAQIETVNGCCYGKDSKPDKGNYSKYCGQDFWELITGMSDFYLQIIEPLGCDAKRRTDGFNNEYAKIINRFISEFSEDFCTPSYEIDWAKLLAFNSGNQK
jgi:hypothetical protein